MLYIHLSFERVCLYSMEDKRKTEGKWRWDFPAKVQLIYNVVSISATQQSDLAIHIHIDTFFLIFFSITVYHSIFNIAPLCYILGSRYSCILNVIICIYQPQTLSASRPLPSSLLTIKSLSSMSMSLFLFCR